MSEMNARDAKLVQYMSEAYGKEQELEMALESHIRMTTKAPYKKRLKDHLRETKSHSKQLDRRIKQLGGGGHKVQTAVGKVTAAVKGPLHVARGSGEQEKMLKNAKTEYFNEHEEIATYLGIETLAEKVGDTETAKMARGIRKEEERMAKFLEGQIKTLSKAVAMEEIPAAERTTSRSTARRPARSSNGSAPTARKRSTAARSKKPAARKPKAKAGSR